MIHDRYNCLWHPLVGQSPIVAAALSATQGLRIQYNSTNFFRNSANPSGLLTAPGTIDQATADRLQQWWAANFQGENSGNVGVVGDDLKFQPLSISAVDAQLIEQLKITAENACTVFHVPGYKLGIGPTPTQSNIESLNLDYYTQGLQVLVEHLEGAGSRPRARTQFDD